MLFGGYYTYSLNSRVPLLSCPVYKTHVSLSYSPLVTPPDLTIQLSAAPDRIARLTPGTCGADLSAISNEGYYFFSFFFFLFHFPIKPFSVAVCFQPSFPIPHSPPPLFIPSLSFIYQ